MSCPVRDRIGAGGTTIGRHVPSRPGNVQVWFSSVHAVSQHTPSTQFSDRHWLGVMQGWPSSSAGVLVGVPVGVNVGVLVGVTVGVKVGVAVGVLMGVNVGVNVGVAVGVLVGVNVGVEVGV